MTKNYILITNILTYDAALKHIHDNVYVAYDTETTGLNVRKDKIIGFGFTGKVAMGYYFPIFKYDKESDTLVDCTNGMDPRPLLDALKDKKLIMHNASYDIRITMNDLKINLLGSLHADTVLMQHTLDEESEYSLKSLAERYKVEIGLDEQDASNQEQLALAESIKANGGKWLKTQKDIYKGSMELIGYYGCADVDMTLRLFEYLENRLLAENLHEYFYFDESMPLYKYCTVKMEHRGVYLNMPKLRKGMEEIQEDLDKLEKIVVDALLATPEGKQFVTNRISEDFAPKNTGGFAQAICRYYGLELPLTAAGKFSITKKTVTAAIEFEQNGVNIHEKINALFFLQSGDATLLLDSQVKEIQSKLLKESDNSDYYININSKTHLGKIVFELMSIPSLSKTEKGAPQFNETFVEHLAEEYGFDWAIQLRLYNKLTKIQGSYFTRFMEQQEDGIFYPTFKQHGTTSGRYSSDMQQLPKPKEEDEKEHPLIEKYNNMIKELFIPKPGYAYIDDDYESLEPRVFADDAGDEALIKIFTDNLDMYSVVAIRAENITDASADKKAPNFLKKLHPTKRQNAKKYALGIRYGLKAPKLAKDLAIEMFEAEEIIFNYFTGFPKLKSKMDHYLREAKTTGQVISKFGRIRHLPRIKEIYDRFGDGILDYKKLGLLAKRHNMTYAEIKDIRKVYNGLLNNALNFPIQTTATSIVNRAGIAMSKMFMEEGIDAWVSLQIHDEWVVTANEKDLERACQIVQECMENTNTLLMPLIATPTVAYNLRDGK